MNPKLHKEMLKEILCKIGEKSEKYEESRKNSRLKEIILRNNYIGFYKHGYEYMS